MTHGLRFSFDFKKEQAVIFDKYGLIYIGLKLLPALIVIASTIYIKIRESL
jgi:hypothetical protein